MKKIKKNQKGFTLVEIIVVLVILAILAAAAIPTMLGFVQDARNRTEIANARAAFVAAQSIATEDFVTGRATPRLTSGTNEVTDIIALTGALDPNPSSITPTIDANGNVTRIVYVGRSTITIDRGQAAVIS